MRVYRYLTESELNNMLAKNYDKLGRCFINTRKIKDRLANTFRYKGGEKYLHFFKDKESMERIKRIRMDQNKANGITLTYYYCEFEINPIVLFFAAGKGFYNEYDENGNRTAKISEVREYAVKAKHFNRDWLVDYVKDMETDKENKMDSLSIKEAL